MHHCPTIRQLCHGAVLLAILLTTACSDRSATPRGHAQPSPTLSRHVTFLQLTDPHVFDAGKGRHAEGVREEELDNWAAFHWAVLETNRLVLAERRTIDFVVITGDFGLENVQLPDVKGVAAETRGCASRKAGDEGPIEKVPLAEAAAEVARELDALIVKRVYLVPGNNDLCREDPKDLHRWAEFVFALQQDLGNLYQARDVSLKQNTKGKTNPVEESDKVTVVDLTDSIARLYDGHDSTVLALFPSGSPKHEEPQVVNGIHLMGLDSAFFKSHDQNDVQTSANTAIAAEIDWTSNQIQPGGAYLVFTHIPDLKDPYPEPGGVYKSSWKLPGKTYDDWRKNILEQSGVLGVFAGHFHIGNRDLYPHNFAYSKPDDVTASKLWLAPPLAEKYQWRLPPEKTARGMLLVSVNADGDTRVAGESDGRVQPAAIWFSTSDQSAAITGDEKLAQARAAELDDQWEDAANKYHDVLVDSSAAPRSRSTALSGYLHAREMMRSWWWQSRVARWVYLDGMRLLYSFVVLLALALALYLVYALFLAFRWVMRELGVASTVVRLFLPFHGRAIISNTVQLTADAPDKEFAARLRAEGEDIKNLLLQEKENWAAGHITLLTPAGTSFDQLVGSIPKVESVALSDWVKFFVNLLQTFRWTVQTGVAVIQPDQIATSAPASGSDRLVPGAQVSAYAVLQWGWIVRNSWHRKFPVVNDRSALDDLARELAELILGEAFV